eukprot:40544-Rhodomonas_salina.2
MLKHVQQIADCLEAQDAARLQREGLGWAPFSNCSSDDAEATVSISASCSLIRLITRAARERRHAGCIAGELFNDSLAA